LRPALDKSFQSNLNMVDHWFSAFVMFKSPRFQHLLLEIRRTLAKDPQKRPSATELRAHICIIDRFNTDSKNSLFEDCCSVPLIPVSEHEETMEAAKTDFQQNIQRIESEHDSTVKALEARIEELEMEKRNIITTIRTPSSPVFRIQAPQQSTHSYVQEPKKQSLHNRIAAGLVAHQDYDSKNGVVRRRSVRKSEGRPPENYQPPSNTTPNQLRASQWNQRHASNLHLPISNEQDDDMDPFLQRDDLNFPISLLKD
jgi:serine/threonine protein kinase